MYVHMYFEYIPGAPKKQNSEFSVPCEQKMPYFLTLLDKASSAEENDTKIIEFGWVILNLCPLLEIQSFPNFSWFLRPMSEELCRDKASIRCFGEAHWPGATKETRINGLPQNTVWKAFPLTIFSLVGHKNQAKFENDCISRNGHKIKIT